MARTSARPPNSRYPREESAAKSSFVSCKNQLGNEESFECNMREEMSVTVDDEADTQKKISTVVASTYICNQ